MAGPSLVLCDAAAALLLLPGKRYVLQLRDDIPGIFYPGHWGCFGGAVEAGESAPQALVRELQEELQLNATLSDAPPFTRFDFQLGWRDGRSVYREYYEVHLSESDLGKLVLSEGAAIRAFSGPDALKLQLTPYDAFAIWLHSNQATLS